jgi:hypothetical protein
MYDKKKKAQAAAKKPSKAFKPCAACPNPKVCKAKGMCMKKAGRK